MSEESAWAKVDELQEQIDRVRAFIDGFAGRGDGLPLTATDELWIMSIRRCLDGDR